MVELAVAAKSAFTHGNSMSANLNIDLGSKDNGPCCVSQSTPEKYYPTVSYHGDKEIELPEEGEMTIKFKRVGKSESTDRSGKESYSCTFEVREIVSCEGCSVEAEDAEEPAGKAKNEAEDALDKLMAEKMAKMKKG